MAFSSGEPVAYATGSPTIGQGVWRRIGRRQTARRGFHAPGRRVPPQLTHIPGPAGIPASSGRRREARMCRYFAVTAGREVEQRAPRPGSRRSEGQSPKSFRLRRAARKGGFATARLSPVLKLIDRRALAGDGLRGRPAVSRRIRGLGHQSRKGPGAPAGRAGEHHGQDGNRRPARDGAVSSSSREGGLEIGRPAKYPPRAEISARRGNHYRDPRGARLVRSAVGCQGRRVFTR